jgi:hypothetical protein
MVILKDSNKCSEIKRVGWNAVMGDLPMGLFVYVNLIYKQSTEEAQIYLQEFIINCRQEFTKKVCI